MIKCLKCGEHKPRTNFSKGNLCKGMHECRECQCARLGAEAVLNAKDKRHQLSERIMTLQAERAAKVGAMLNDAITSKRPAKLSKKTPEIKNKLDEHLYSKELEEINSMYEL